MTTAFHTWPDGKNRKTIPISKEIFYRLQINPFSQ